MASSADVPGPTPPAEPPGAGDEANARACSSAGGMPLDEPPPMPPPPPPQRPARGAAHASRHRGIRQYYLHEIQELLVELDERTQNLRRLEAQRNALNAKGARVSRPAWTDRRIVR